MSQQTISINGRFLGRPISGVERYGRELLKAWDRLRETQYDRPFVRILTPHSCVSDMQYNTMQIEPIGRLRGHAWEQLELPLASRDDILLSLANSGPIMHRNHIVVIHDAAIFRFPRNYGLLYRNFHRALGMLLSRSANIATVSQFSRHELAQCLNIASDQIAIISNGSEHLGNTSTDDNIFAKLGIADQRFFLTVGSVSKNKNLDLVLAAWKNVPDVCGKLIIVGDTSARVFGNSTSSIDVANIVQAGRVHDAELASLYKQATALLFPSKYEGFGIPPLEALSYSCPVLAADIPAVREVCGDAARYFPVNDPQALKELMIETVLHTKSERWTKTARHRLSLYRWEDSARTLEKFVMSLSQQPKRRGA